MSDADTSTTNHAIVERLDRIEAALLKLVDAVSAIADRGVTMPATAPAPAPAAAPAATSAPPADPDPTGPPIIDVAPPTKQPPVAAPRPAPAPRSPVRQPTTPVASDASVFMPYADREDLPVPPVDAGYQAVLTRVFEAVQLDDVEDTWALMARLTHSSQLVGPRSLDHFKAFSWHKARRTAHEYLDATRAPDSYTIDYTEPATVDANVDRVKVFIRKPGNRLPAPIVLARDPKADGAWRVAQISL
ncbi:MAG: hypothetical protein CSA66_05180 [Proteobacteria bacterium]|nr:MAG: hypothetical protein CSA66_05180 [Pseudomonadota bacterium]